MKLFDHPALKFRTKDRLHVSKELGLLSLLSLFSVTCLGFLVDYYIIPDYFILHAGFLLMCLIVSLNFMKTWDLVMDREENLGTMVTRSWYQAFSITVPEENIQRFSLSSVSSVIVTSDSTIDINTWTGSVIQIKSGTNNYRLLKNLRKDISVFLCLEKIEHLEGTEKTFNVWDVEPWTSSSGVSENQESDTETIENFPVEEERQGGGESQFDYGSNIKILTGVL